MTPDPTPTSDAGVSVVIPFQPGDQVGGVSSTLRAWRAVLTGTRRPFELIVVAPPLPEVEQTELDAATQAVASVRLVVQPRPGFGVALRAGLEASRHPLFFYTAFDYPYRPADFPPFLERIQLVDERLGIPANVVAGCRTGHPLPPFWYGLGKLYRGFARVALGMPLSPMPGWLGWREHLRAWRAGVVFGVPLHDPNCAFKLFRRNVFEKFSIQSDGGFVHAELVAKCTFVTSIIDELPLSPSPAPVPRVEWSESGRVFRHPAFTPQRPLAASVAVTHA